MSTHRSLIAGANAWFRARESVRPEEERLLDDAWAPLLAERDPRVLAVRCLRWLVPPLRVTLGELAMAHCVRHRALDQLLLAAVGRDGFRQVVVIGAGYDMRAFRFRAALQGVRWIELDDAGTQERKRHRLARLSGSRSIGYASTDLEREPLAPVLARAGWNPDQATCYVLEGLVHYLSAPALSTLFAQLGRPGQRSRILVSFIDADMRERASRTVRALFRLMGERPRSLLEAQAMTDLLAGHGYRDLRLWTFPDQLRDFVPAAVHARRDLRARWWQTIAEANRQG